MRVDFGIEAGFVMSAFGAKADIRFGLRHLTNNLYGSCNFFDGAKAERILHTFDFDNSRFVNTRLRF